MLNKIKSVMLGNVLNIKRLDSYLSGCFGRKAHCNRVVNNRRGYMSKPALMGTVLGAITLIVGIGVVSNFSGSGSGAPKSSLSSYTSFDNGSLRSSDLSSYSRRDIDSMMAESQYNRERSGIDALRQGGDNGLLGYAGRARGSNIPNSVNSEGSYEGSSVDGMQGGGIDASQMAGYASGSGSGVNTAGMTPEQYAAAAEAQAKKKGLEGPESAKLRTSSSIGGKLSTSGMAAGASGGSYSTSLAGQYNSNAKDSSSKSVNRAAASGLPGGAGSGIDGKSMGRVGAMGGSNVKGGSAVSNAGGQQQYTVSDNLTRAYLLSRRATGFSTKETAKSAVYAEAAFQGNPEASGVDISHEAGVSIASAESLAGVASSVGDELGNALIKHPKLDCEVNPDGCLDNKIKEGDRLRNKAQMLMLAMAGMALVASLAIIVASKWPVYGWITALAVTGVALAGMLTLMLLENENGITGIADKLDSDPDYGGSGSMKASGWVTFGLCSAAMGIAWVSSSPQLSTIKNFFTNLWGNFMETKLGSALADAGGVIKDVLKFFGL
jgi:hypothetical protein